LEPSKSRLNPIPDRLSRLPWWVLVAALLGVMFAWTLVTDETYSGIFGRVSQGIIVTLRVTIISYTFAIVLGLIVGLGRVSRNIFVYQISTFYIEILRGLPTLVVLLYVAFVVVPAAADALNGLGRSMIESNTLTPLGELLSQIQTRNIENEFRVIIALVVAYSAFLAEIFRAGIESIERGQMEAALALGMSHWQAMIHVILRQAIRIVLPPLGNDFIAMLKDSSLVSVLGVVDITQRGKLEISISFRVFEAYNVVAFLYLVLTLLLSMGVKWLERAMSRERA
jgi:polar amino acid transport system permease protein